METHLQALSTSFATQKSRLTHRPRHPGRLHRPGPAVRRRLPGNQNPHSLLPRGGSVQARSPSFSIPPGRCGRACKPPRPCCRPPTAARTRRPGPDVPDDPGTQRPPRDRDRLRLRRRPGTPARRERGEHLRRRGAHLLGADHSRRSPRRCPPCRAPSSRRPGPATASTSSGRSRSSRAPRPSTPSPRSRSNSCPETPIRSSRRSRVGSGCRARSSPITPRREPATAVGRRTR